MFLEAQIEEIKIHRWIESEKAHKDLGQTAEFDWIKKYAKTFREIWEREHPDGSNSSNCSGRLT